MKKSTKSLWIYAAVLFILAIGLIFTATILQARLISDDGGIEVLGTFTKNTKQSIADLTDKNIQLTNELAALQQQTATLQEEYDALKSQYDAAQQKQDLLRQMYDAYNKDDYETLEPLLGQITQEEADALLPGFYETARDAVEANKD